MRQTQVLVLGALGVLVPAGLACKYRVCLMGSSPHGGIMAARLPVPARLMHHYI